MTGRREIIRTVAIVCVLWVAVTVLLAQWQQRTQKLPPPFLHYPGYERVPEQTIPNLGSRKYWFTLRESYPSLSVFHFYDQALRARGWRPLWKTEPAWQRTSRDDTRQDGFSAMWVSRDRQYQLQLQMQSTVKVLREGERVVSETRRPGIQVWVTMQRSVGPWLLGPTEERKAVPQIDIKKEPE